MVEDAVKNCYNKISIIRISTDMRKWTWLLTLLLFILSAPTLAAGKAVLLTINGAIGPGVQDYITRGIDQAEEMKASLVIIQMNTPGGLETSMLGINEAIVSASIPVVTYVSPSGARAASAGTFIMYASNFAIMAPGTNIGAATPVDITPEENINPKLLDTHEAKIIQDAAAYLRSLAQLRGRNVDWADQAVNRSASITADEALQLKVINNIATNIPQLLQEIDGKATQVLHQTQIVSTKNLEIIDIQPDWRSQFLAFITDPNIAYLLMLAAIYGLFFEFSNPGIILPGVTGLICLFLALYAFQLMPVNYVGLSLIFIGMAFLVFEVYISSFGILAIAGVIAFVIGSVMLYDANDDDFRITTTLILGMTTLTTAFVIAMVLMMVNSHKRRVITGHEALIGRDVIVMPDESGMMRVMLDGEIWNAESTSVLTPGQHVKVIKAQGLILTVKPINKDN